MKTIGWRWVPIILFIILSVFLWRGLSLNPHALPSVQVGRELPSFKLPELENPQQFFDSQKIRNRVVLLNVWASWCAACTDEQVFMLQLAREGVPIYGLNYKDNREDALRWLAQWGNPYQMIGADKQGKIAIDLGVYGAPETFIIDKKGIIRYRHAGVMNQTIWEHDMLPLMQQLEQSI